MAEVSRIQGLRTLLVATGLTLGACAAPAAHPPTAAPAQPVSTHANSEWDRVLAAARAEGKVSVVIPLGDAYRLGIEAFQKAYPDIQLEASALHPRDWVPRVQQERAAGQFLWDVYVGGPDVDVYRLADEGTWEPIKDDLLLPEVLDDSKWRRGFDDGFSDKGKRFTYNFIKVSTTGFCCVNRDFVPESELPNFEGLLDPKWRGKIVWNEPRQSGSGVNNAAVVLYKYGEPTLRQVFNQDVVVTADQRQLTEWVVRGRYPIGIGLIDRDLKATFHPQGVGLNVKDLPVPGLMTGTPQSGSVSVISKAPHPNARKVFVNWLLSREGQTAVVEETRENSRRLDVPVMDPERVPPAEGELLNTQAEEFAPIRSRANDIAKEIFK